MTEEADSEKTMSQAVNERRGILKKALYLLLAGVGVSPVGITILGLPDDSSGENTAEMSSEENASQNHRFEILAAEHLEIDYQLEADAPIEAVTHPVSDRGAELDGNDDIKQNDGSKVRVSGTTGFGYDDTWRVENVRKNRH